MINDVSVLKDPYRFYFQIENLFLPDNRFEFEIL